MAKKNDTYIRPSPKPPRTPYDRMRKRREEEKEESARARPATTEPAIQVTLVPSLARREELCYLELGKI